VRDVELDVGAVLGGDAQSLETIVVDAMPPITGERPGRGQRRGIAGSIVRTG
jgi:hypothetical protein